MTSPFLPFARPSIDPESIAAVAEVFRSGQLASGPKVQAFEAALAAYLGAGRHVRVMTSATAGLEMALEAAGVGEGDEVALPAHTFIATSEVVRRLGARVRFCEIDEATFTLDPALLEKAITPRTRVVVPVHLYGHPADFDPIAEIAARRGLRVIEDAAQAHGARYRGNRCGALASLAAFSFYPGKNLGAYGDAGGITATDTVEMERMRSLSNHGRLDKHRHSEEGFNYRLDGLQAAVLRVKLRHLDAWNAERRRAAGWYAQRLAAVPGVVLPGTAPWAEHVFHLFVVRVADRDRVIARLQERGVGAGIHYPVPLHLQPAYAHLGHREGDFPVTERVAKEIISLPIYPEITEEQVDRVCDALRESLAT
jgi:dTDP-3-amino-3,4,6-trideoxy-alpha-D-glucose transaminase